MNTNAFFGLRMFINKANSDMIRANDRYMNNRPYVKSSEDHEKLLNRANEEMYEALKEKALFVDLANKTLEEEEEF